MAVVCAACNTENRDSAMFCRGCARKLPGFAASGPSALETMRALRPASAPVPISMPMPADMLPVETRGFWIRLALLALALLVGFVGWYAYVTRKVPAPAAARPPLVAAPPVPAPIAPVPVAPSTPVQEAQALPAAPDVPRPPSARRADVLAERWDPPKKAPARNQPANPRQPCAHLNYIAAARCEAALCEKAEYRRHPRCDAVREQRRRDEARRNPTLGY